MQILSVRCIASAIIRSQNLGFLVSGAYLHDFRPALALTKKSFVNSAQPSIGIPTSEFALWKLRRDRNCDGQVTDAPSPSKARIQTSREGVTSGAQDFENTLQFGHRHLNRADSEKPPRLNPENKHSSTIDLACQSVRNCWRQVVTGAIMVVPAREFIKTILWGGKVLFRFRFLSVR